MAWEEPEMRVKNGKKPGCEGLEKMQGNLGVVY